MAQADGPALRRPGRPTKKHGVYVIKPRVGSEHPSQSGRSERLSTDRDDSQHPFGDQATATCSRVSLKLGSGSFGETALHVRPFGFASQPYDWFAFSRMMTLQARLTRNYASDDVGQALC